MRRGGGVRPLAAEKSSWSLAVLAGGESTFRVSTDSVAEVARLLPLRGRQCLVVLPLCSFFLAQFVGISVAPPDSFYFVPILQMASGVTSTRKCQAFCSRFANATSAARSEDASTTMALAFAHLSFIIIYFLPELL